MNNAQNEVANFPKNLQADTKAELLRQAVFLARLNHLDKVHRLALEKKLEAQE
jgi:hypothetical protein